MQRAAKLVVQQVWDGLEVFKKKKSPDDSDAVPLWSQFNPQYEEKKGVIMDASLFSSVTLWGNSGAWC